MGNDNLQASVNQVQWYHEFDFGNGVKAHSLTPDVEWHRKVWRFIELQLDGLDFKGKTVLDIGAWDGYWSFWAERKGAASVLATDDATQNWSNGQGLLLAKELLGSAIDVNQNLSIYQLSSLERTFDIVMCLGVYYHLVDPFYAFSQIRHCCHSSSVVVLEGNAGRVGMRANEVRYVFEDPSQSVFTPSASALESFLEAVYLRVQSQVWLGPGRFRRTIGLLQNLKRYRIIDPVFLDRVFTVCVPFEGTNTLHPYEPPFGLKRYDDRFRQSLS